MRSDVCTLHTSASGGVTWRNIMPVQRPAVYQSEPACSRCSDAFVRRVFSAPGRDAIILHTFEYIV